MLRRHSLQLSRHYVFDAFPCVSMKVVQMKAIIFTWNMAMCKPHPRTGHVEAKQEEPGPITREWGGEMEGDADQQKTARREGGQQCWNCVHSWKWQQGKTIGWVTQFYFFKVMLWSLKLYTVNNSCCLGITESLWDVLGKRRRGGKISPEGFVSLERRGYVYYMLMQT